MNKRKSHHYVPQFYLRNFASSENGREVGLYGYRNNLYIPKASIKHQACEKFLYGIDDQIEAALSKLENLTAQTIQKIFQSLSPPPEKTIFFYALKEFTLHQISRTKKAGIELNNQVSTTYKELLKKSPIYKEEYKDIEFFHQQPTLLSLIYSAGAWPLMKFLSCKLLINRTSQRFITSDAPAVKYNQFLEIKKQKHGTTGIATKGLQIFLPIHPQAMMIFYDPFVYKLQGRDDATIYTDDVRDVDQLNSLQFINCDQQLFFGHGVTQTYLTSLANKYNQVKKRSGPTSKTYETENYYNGEQSYFLLHTHSEPQIELNFSFLKLTKSAKAYSLGDRLVHPRHPDLVSEDALDRLNRPYLFEE
jgi:hypothetical protein